MMFHKVRIGRRAGSGEHSAMTGSSCEVTIDGKQVKGLTALRFECEAGGVAKLFLEMVADVTLEGEMEVSAEKSFVKCLGEL